MKPISAYLPCFNNAGTIARAIASVQNQTVAITELFVIDDGSTDQSAEVMDGLRVRTIRHATNLGRGAVRAAAMHHARHDLVLSCDAGAKLPNDFLERATRWMGDDRVAAVFGRVIQAEPRTPTERWRGRHLFKTESETPMNRRASLATSGVLLRRSAVLEAGNFDPRFRQCEDVELGERLLRRGHDVIFDPALAVTALGTDSLRGLLDRYGRWNLPHRARFGWNDYLRQVRYSLKVMVRADLRKGDPAAAVISLFCPHYLYGKAFLRRKSALR